MKFKSTFPFLIAMLLILNGFSQSLKEQVEAIKSSTNKNLSLDIFSPNNAHQDSEVNLYVSKFEVFTINFSELDRLKSESHDLLVVKFRFEDIDYEMELIPNEIYASTENVNYTPPSGARFLQYNQNNQHYKGVLKGIEGSICSFSIINGEVSAMISSPNMGTLEITKNRVANNEYAIYATNNLRNITPFQCYSDGLVENIEQQIQTQIETSSESQRGNGCIEIHFFCDYTMYLSFGSNPVALENFVNGLFNQVSTLYSNESIDVKLGPILTYYTSPDGFSATNSNSALNQFAYAVNYNFVGHLAHLLSTDPFGNGGLAWVDQLCGALPYAYSNISSTYSNFPTYSWSVTVVTHETGHNLGSKHTHWCGWPGGAIDNCYELEDGPCNTGGLPSNGGTMMSYCHLTPSIGINYSNGFGPLPGNLIRDRVANANCINGCNTTSRADLDLYNQSVSAYNVNPGQNLDVSCIVKNIGATTSFSTELAYYLSVDTIARGDLRLDTETLPALNVNQSLTFNKQIPTPTSWGTGGVHYILFRADLGNNNVELNELNNIAWQEVFINAPAPDLITSNISAQNTQVNSNTSLQVNAKVENIGNFESDENYLGYYISSDEVLDGSDQFLGFKITPTISAGSFSDLSLSIFIPQTIEYGNYFIILCSDYDARVAELNETNNCTSFAIEVVDIPADLTVTNTLISDTELSYQESFTVTCEVKNIGLLFATQSVLGYYLSEDTIKDDEDFYLGSDGVQGLAIGGISPESITTSIPGSYFSGTYYILLCADINNAVTEYDETNNCSYLQVTFDNQLYNYENLFLETEVDTFCEGSNGFTVSFVNGAPPYDFLLRSNQVIDTFFNVTANPFTFNYELNDGENNLYASSLLGNVVSNTLDIVYYPPSTASLSGSYGGICFGTILNIPIALNIVNPPATLVISDGYNNYTLPNLTLDSINFEYTATTDVQLQIVEAYDQCRTLNASGSSSVNVRDDTLYAVEDLQLNINTDRSINLSWIDNNDYTYSISYKIYKKDIDSVFYLLATLSHDDTEYIDYTSSSSGSYFVETYTVYCQEYSDTVSYEYDPLFNMIIPDWQLSTQYNRADIIDYDNDFDDDLIVGGKFLIINDGAYNFNQTQEIFSGNGKFAALDYTGDGKTDMVNKDGVNINNNVGFTLVSSVFNGVNYNFDFGTWYDIDNDGDLDQFDSDFLNDSLVFLQNGWQLKTAPFSPSPSKTTLVESENVLFDRHYLIDVDNDGNMDFIGVHDDVLKLLMNEGNGKLGALITINLGNIPCVINKEGWLIADFNNDLFEDVLITFNGANNEGCNSILLINNNGTLTPTALNIKSATVFPAPVGGDFDNDGDLDFIHPASSPSYNLSGALMMNNGNGTFSKLYGHPFTSIVNRNEIVVSDFEDDGWLDVFSSDKVFHTNEFKGLSNNNWIKFRLEAYYSNKSAIGANIKLYTTINGTPKTLMRTLKNNVVLNSNQSSIVHFGLGNAVTVDSVVVSWPSGVRTKLLNVAVNQKLVVSETGSIPALESPTKLRVIERTFSSIELAWNFTSSYNNGYIIYRKDENNNNYSIIDTTNYSTYIDYGTIADVEYCYKLKSIRSNNVTSGFTNELCVEQNDTDFIIDLANRLHPITRDAVALKIASLDFEPYPLADSMHVELSVNGGSFQQYQTFTLRNYSIEYGYKWIENLTPLTDYCVRYYYEIENLKFYSTSFCFTTKSECYSPVSLNILQNKDTMVYCEYSSVQAYLQSEEPGYTYTLLSNGFPVAENIGNQIFIFYDYFGGHLEVIAQKGTCIDTVDLKVLLLGKNHPKIEDVMYCSEDDIKIKITGAPMSEIIVHTNNTFSHQLIPGYIIPEGISSDSVYYQIEIKDNSPLVQVCNRDRFTEKNKIKKLQDLTSIGGDYARCRTRFNYSTNTIKVTPTSGVYYDWEYRAADSLDWERLAFESDSEINPGYDYGFYRCILTSILDPECADTTANWEFINSPLFYSIQGYVLDVDGDPVNDLSISVKIDDCTQSQGWDFYKGARTDENGFFSVSLSNIPCISVYRVTFEVAGESFVFHSTQPDEDIFDSVGICTQNLIFELPFNYEITSTEENVFGSLLIWPNPAKDFLYISFGESSQLPNQIKLLNIEGKMLKEWDRTAINNYNSQLNISEISSEGIYMLQFIYNNDESKSFYKKILITRD